MEELEEFDEKEKTKKSDKEKEKKKEKKKKENPKEKAKTDKDAGFLWTMPRSLSVPVMCRALDQYVQYWNLKLELDNLEQGMDLQVRVLWSLRTSSVSAVLELSVAVCSLSMRLIRDLYAGDGKV